MWLTDLLLSLPSRRGLWLVDVHTPGLCPLFLPFPLLPLFPRVFQLLFTGNDGVFPTEDAVGHLVHLTLKAVSRPPIATFGRVAFPFLPVPLMKRGKMKQHLNHTRHIT